MNYELENGIDMIALIKTILIILPIILLVIILS